MLFALTITFITSSILFSIFLIGLMIVNYRKTGKLLSPDVKILLGIVIVLSILIAPLHFARKSVEKNIEMETSFVELDSENCYMITSMYENGNTLFICKEDDGELRYVWAKLEETNSTPCLETTTYQMSKWEKFLTFKTETTYVISTDSKYIKFVYDINDVPLGELG